MLPDNIEKFYNKLIVRFFRVIGGACAVLVLTNNYMFIPYPWVYFILVLALIQVFQIVIISIIKLHFSIKKALYHKEEFEIRNSPLHVFGSKLFHLSYCWKIGCTMVGGGVGMIASGANIDSLLDSAGYEKIFLLTLGKSFRFITGGE